MTTTRLNNEEKETGRVRKEAVLGKSMQELASQWPAQPHPSADQPQPPPGGATLPHLNNSQSQLLPPLPPTRNHEELPWPLVYSKARSDHPEEPRVLIHKGEASESWASEAILPTFGTELLPVSAAAGAVTVVILTSRPVKGRLLHLHPACPVCPLSILRPSP